MWCLYSYSMGYYTGNSYYSREYGTTHPCTTEQLNKLVKRYLTKGNAERALKQLSSKWSYSEDYDFRVINIGGKL